MRLVAAAADFPACCADSTTGDERLSTPLLANLEQQRKEGIDKRVVILRTTCILYELAKTMGNSPSCG